MVKKKILLALDGLSKQDLSALLELLPKTAPLLNSHSLVSLQANSTQPHSVWAEILTGEPWFENGCAGFSRPKKSLNELSIFSELDLQKPVKILGNAPATVVAINLPLIHPSRGYCVWLSDGSLPTNRIISPANLSTSEPFKTYVPRPLTSLAFASGTIDSAQKVISCAINHLQCATTIFSEKDWHIFAFRITLFDILSHLIGMHFLQAHDLRVFGLLKSYLTKLDDALQSFLTQSGSECLIFSAFSHTTCNSILNLSKILQDGDFLQLKAANGTTRGAHERMASATALYGTRLTRHFLAATEARVAQDSIACSPTAGSVFINAKKRFSSGCVGDLEYDQVRRELREYLQDWLQTSGFSTAALNENPKQLEELKLSTAPEFVVTLPGVEMTDLMDFQRGAPLTTHAPTGFVLLPNRTGAPQPIKPTEIINQFGN